MNSIVSTIEAVDPMVEERKCCECIHFKFEDMEGWGLCAKLQKIRPKTNGITRCSDMCTCGEFVSESVKSRHLAVLRKCKQCLCNNIGTSHDFDVRAINEAIDFVTDYVNLY